MQLNRPLDTWHGCCLIIAMHVIVRFTWTLKVNRTQAIRTISSKRVAITISANVSFQDKWNIVLYVAYALSLVNLLKTKFAPKYSDNKLENISFDNIATL